MPDSNNINFEHRQINMKTSNTKNDENELVPFILICVQRMAQRIQFQQMKHEKKKRHQRTIGHHHKNGPRQYNSQNYTATLKCDEW